MKKITRFFIVSTLIVVLIMSTVMAATDLIQIEVGINRISISLNGKIVGAANENYTLSNGDQVPNSILYKGTTYLPIKKISEVLGMEVTWDAKTYTAGLINKDLNADVEEVEEVVESNVKNIDGLWIVECNISELPVTIDAYNGMSVTINTLDAKETGILMDITMINNSTVSDKGKPMVSTWEIYDGTRTLEDVSSDRIFYDTSYLRSQQVISGNIGYQGMTSGTETLILYGGLWQYIDKEEFKVIVHLNK